MWPYNGRWSGCGTWTPRPDILFAKFFTYRNPVKFSLYQNCSPIMEACDEWGKGRMKEEDVEISIFFPWSINRSLMFWNEFDDLITMSIPDTSISVVANFPVSMKHLSSQQAHQCWINVDSTSIFNVVSTLNLGWIWKLGGRCFNVSTLSQRCFDVVSMLYQRLSDVVSTL